MTLPVHGPCHLLIVVVVVLREDDDDGYGYLWRQSWGFRMRLYESISVADTANCTGSIRVAKGTYSG